MVLGTSANFYLIDYVFLSCESCHELTNYHNLLKVLEGMEMSMEQFIDLCILLGCDYCEKIRGMGPKSAIKLIQEHKTIEGVVEKVKGDKKYTVPENWPFKEARRLFREAVQ